MRSDEVKLFLKNEFNAHLVGAVEHTDENMIMFISMSYQNCKVYVAYTLKL